MLNANGRYLIHPLYGKVFFDSRFSQIIDLPCFYNLRNLSQIGSIQFVPEFIAANRTRLHHSVGVYAIMKKLIRNCRSNNILRISKQAEDVMLLAALGHDIGHLPFSHVLEHKEQISHESRTIKILLENRGMINQIFRYDIVSKVVFVLQKQNVNFENSPFIDFHDHLACCFLRNLLDGPIDCDRFEYVRTDRWTIYGVDVDFWHILRNVNIFYKDIKPLPFYPFDSVREIDRFLLIRSGLYTNVYYSNCLNLVEMAMRELEGRSSVDISTLTEHQIIARLTNCLSDKDCPEFEKRFSQIIIQGKRNGLLYRRFTDIETYNDFLNQVKSIVPEDLVFTHEQVIKTYSGGIYIQKPDGKIVDFKEVSKVANQPNIHLFSVMVDLQLCNLTASKANYLRKLFEDQIEL